MRRLVRISIKKRWKGDSEKTEKDRIRTGKREREKEKERKRNE